MTKKFVNKTKQENVSVNKVDKKLVKPIVNHPNKTPNTSLEEKTLNSDSPLVEKKQVIEKIVLELNVPETYKTIEKKLRKQLLDEEDALDLGVKPDKYYSAKAKEDQEDEFGRTLEESSGSFGHQQSSR